MTLQEKHKLLPLLVAMQPPPFLRRKVKQIFDNRAGKDFKKPLNPSFVPISLAKHYSLFKVKLSFLSPPKLICKTINLSVSSGPLNQDGQERPSLEEGKPKAVQEF